MGMRLCAQPSLRHSQIAIARFNKKRIPKDDLFGSIGEQTLKVWSTEARRRSSG